MAGGGGGGGGINVFLDSGVCVAISDAFPSMFGPVGGTGRAVIGCVSCSKLTRARPPAKRRPGGDGGLRVNWERMTLGGGVCGVMGFPRLVTSCAKDDVDDKVVVVVVAPGWIGG